MKIVTRRSPAKFDAASVRRHYRVALSIVALLSILSFVTMQLALLTHQFNLRLASLGNEQMSLFQRSGLLTRNLLQAAGDPDATNEDLERMREQILQTTARLIRSHDDLLRLDAEGVLGIVKTNVAARYYFTQPYELDRKLREFVRDAEFLAKADLGSLRQQYANWAPVMLTMASNGTMIRGFDEAMAEFASTTSKHMQMSQRILLAMTLLMLVTLALETVFIFKPLVSRLQTEHEQLSLSERELDHLAHHDPLTGLANRARFDQALSKQIASSDHSGQQFGILVVDLDDFKLINDSMGHPAGDALLVEVAKRLTACLRGGDVAARLGGDEFAVLVSEVKNPTQLSALAHRLHEALIQAFTYEGQALRPRGSIGGAVYPADADHLDLLLKRADMAMYAAKIDGKAGGPAIQMYADAKAPAALPSQPLDRDLREGIERGELFVEYQPKCRLKDGQHRSFEALVRWSHPTLGRLLPDSFLEMAHRLSLMPELTRAVLTVVADDLARWRSMGLTPGPVAINMPEVMLARDLAGAAIDEALAVHGLPSSSLSIEITEEVFADRRAAVRVRHCVEGLRRRGMRIAFDDFGTGFASLTHLRDFPLDEIKIDRSFIRELGVDRSCDVIVCALIQLGQGLGKHIVAEGVETAAQEAFLLGQGCDEVQGYRYARPLSFEAASEWLSGQQVAAWVPLLLQDAMRNSPFRESA